jgi:hypothetical protein
LRQLGTWQRFARRVVKSKAALLKVIDELRAAGQTVVGYGAPAKGMTLLSYCGIGPERLSYLVDRSPCKQGLLTPGHHIPVNSPERIMLDCPHVMLLLAWNFAREIAVQQNNYLRRGGRLLVPIPMPHYWGTR